MTHSFPANAGSTTPCQFCGCWRDEQDDVDCVPHALEKITILAHGDLDGMISTSAILRQYPKAEITFTQPFLLDSITIPGLIVVVDIAANNRDIEMPQRFIDRHMGRILRWYDHHKGWGETGIPSKYNFMVEDDSYESCACHFRDSIPEWQLWDSIVADTRKGTLSATGQLIEEAVKSNMGDDSIRLAAVRLLVGDETQQATISVAAEKYKKVKELTEHLTKMYYVQDGIAIIDARGYFSYDLTQLLLAGQERALVALVLVSTPATEAQPTGEFRISIATKRSDINLVALFGLQSGSASRVSLPFSRFEEAKRILEA